MLKITHPIQNQNQNQNQTQPKPQGQAGPAPTEPGVKPMRSMEELMKIKERVEETAREQKQRSHQAIAEMFLAGPLAWPDYPESEELEFSEDEWEEWIPMDCDSDCNHDSKLRDLSSDGL